LPDSVRFVSIPSTITTCSAGIFNDGTRGPSNSVCILYCTTPPQFIGDPGSMNVKTYKRHFYVPDEAVDTYKGATNWS
jgi:hypothetical protein